MGASFYGLAYGLAQSGGSRRQRLTVILIGPALRAGAKLLWMQHGMAPLAVIAHQHPEYHREPLSP
ncbi:hypothetical protein KAM373_22970 [Aeromonas caviae]|nr:hypothetical protein KAM373_22970 [Aeromonas caviae]